jgi:ERCC4-related helicase
VGTTNSIFLISCSTCPILTCQDESVEMTSNTGKAGDRAGVWASRRLFFCTPNILQNDLRTGKCPEKR